MQRGIRHLRVQLEPINEWIRNTLDLRSQSPEMALVEEPISKGIKKIQTRKCLNCDQQGHFKRNSKETQTTSKKESIFFGNTQKMS